MQAAKPLFDYPKYWAECFGPAPFLPMSREEMDQLGWDSCDVIIVTGDAYVDHPSFGMAVIGRLLEAQGYRVGIISQPDWHSKDDFMKLGKPNLFFGVAAGNMDSMINRYTADRKVRSDDAYTAGGQGGKRPDRASLVYSQRCREAFKDVPIVLGGIEASLRRIAHYDYWQDKVRHSLLVDAKADILLYGNAERAVVEVAHRLSRGEPIQDITDVRGTAFIRRDTPEGWFELDSTRIDRPGKIDKMGYKGVETTELVLEGHRISADQILGGEPGKGFFHMMDGVEVGRVNVAARACGLAWRGFELAVEYAQQRKTFGKAIAEHQAVLFRLAEMATKVEVAHTMMVRAARLKDKGERMDVEAGMAKMVASEYANEVVEDAFRIHGGYGYSKEYEIERLMREVKFMLIGEGTSDIQKMIIGRQLLKEYKL